MADALDLSLTEYLEANPVEQTEDVVGYTDQRAIPIMDSFLQPESTISLETAALSILDLIEASEKAGRARQQINFARLCYEIAKNIPWNHPSMLRLAWLVDKLGWSNRFTRFGDIESPADGGYRNWPFSEIRKEQWDKAQSIEYGYNDEQQQKELAAWISICAFEANLDALHVFSQESPFPCMTLDAVLGRSTSEPDCKYHPDASCVTEEALHRPYRDAYIVAAAQWLVWDGQNLYRRALYKPPQGGDVSRREYSDVERTDITIAKLISWKEGFRDAAAEEGISKEARDLALHASFLIGTLEMVMGDGSYKPAVRD